MEFVPLGLKAGTPTAWANECSNGGNPTADTTRIAAKDALSKLALDQNDMQCAAQRWKRMEPLLRKGFGVSDGRIASELRLIPKMAEALFPARVGGSALGSNASVFLKMDSHLAVCGSVKARGGFFEVLEVAEKIGMQCGVLGVDDHETDKLLCDKAKEELSKYTVSVGSTGNLGMSVGLGAAVLGMRAVVHMSVDAKQWKKDRLRASGVEVVEHAGAYNEAVEAGRQTAAGDPRHHFIDDEGSKTLFLGYSCAALELKNQLDAQNIFPTTENPLICFLPCGVGGAPGGICWGLKQVYGDAVCVVFVEPTRSPCVMLSLATGLGSDVCVQDIGLDNKTEADGLAVARASALCCEMTQQLVDACCTVEDAAMFRNCTQLFDTEGVFVEPSSACVFSAPSVIQQATAQPKQQQALQRVRELITARACAHVFWMTGGALVPESVQQGVLQRGREQA